MTEEWRPIEEWEGMYEVSSMGRVRSLTRMVQQGNRWGQIIARIQRGRILKQSGVLYRHVALCRDGQMEHPNIHVLVASAFLAFKIGCPFVCHNDNDTTNNAVENLRYDTWQGNMNDRFANGTHPAGENNGRAVLSEDQVKAILSSRDADRALARDYGVCPATIGHIRTRRTWKNLSAA